MNRGPVVKAVDLYFDGRNEACSIEEISSLNIKTNNKVMQFLEKSALIFQLRRAQPKSLLLSDLLGGIWGG